MASRGLLLINLGSPRAPETADVAEYLNEFLMDPYVIDLPAWLRWPLVRLLITPRRASKSAEAYRKIWTEEGSPLVNFTRKFSEGVRRELSSEFDVRWAMRYGQPSIESVIGGWSVDEIYVVPLYPQYAESSTRTAIDVVKRFGGGKKLHFLEDFHAAPEFLRAQSRQISKHVASFKPDHVLLSFHGLPEHHMSKLHPQHCLKTADCCAQVTPANRHCYRAQAFATARGLELPGASVSFQSRLGRRPWIKPYTDVVIEDLARQGKKRVLVSCPSFVADCLETLEEIQMRLREQFLAAGGQELQLVPALNDEPEWIRSFAQMIRRQWGAK